jgi:hypothetical protein
VGSGGPVCNSCGADFYIELEAPELGSLCPCMACGEVLVFIGRGCETALVTDELLQKIKAASQPIYEQLVWALKRHSTPRRPRKL